MPKIRGDFARQSFVSPFFANPRFRPLFHPADVTGAQWCAMTQEEFAERFGTTPMARSGLERIKGIVGR